MFIESKLIESNDECSGSDQSLNQSFDYTERSFQLENEIVKQAAFLNAADYRFILLLREFDDGEYWAGDGIKSFAHWLNWKVGLNPVVAREKVRVARALKDLPKISEAFEQGEVSYSKVRAMTRVATERNEDLLMMIAQHGTAAHVEKLTAKYQLCKRLEEPGSADDWKREPSLSWYQDESDMMVITAKLPTEDGLIVVDAIQQMAEKIRSELLGKTIDKTTGQGNNANVNTGAYRENVSAETFQDDDAMPDISVIRATALVEMAKRENSTQNRRQDNIHLLIHVNANASSIDHKVNGQDVCYADAHSSQGAFIDVNVARRMACDASLSTVLEDDEGTMISIGRRSRVIPNKMKLALNQRDNDCVFPGCCQQQHTEGHHIKHWANGGETSLENLVSLCKFHHTLLHKGQYQLSRIHGGFTFAGPHGEEITKSYYPQFPNFNEADLAGSYAEYPDITERTAACRWLGETIDMQMTLGGLFQLEASPTELT